MSRTIIHPLSLRTHSFKAKRSSKEFIRKLGCENKHLKILLRQCNEMFIALGYKKRTAILRTEIAQVLNQEKKNE